MKIALCGPADLHPLARLCKADTADVPKGVGPTPLAPLIGELIARGHQVTLYTLSPGVQKYLYFDWGALRVFVGSTRRFRYLYRPEIAYLKQVIRTDAPPFVHVHWTYEYALGALATGVPTIITIHDLPWNVLRYFRDTCRAVRLLMAYMVAAKGRHFTAVSPDAARHFKRWLRPRASIEVIPNFLPGRVFDMGRAHPPRSDRPFTFVTILQGWTRRKNGGCALNAFQLVRKVLPNARLIMVGTDYEEGGAAHAWAMSQGLARGVMFQGVMRHEEMLKFVLQEADVLVHPSLDEAFSVSVLECMALNKPVIAGKRTPGLSWVLDDGCAGSLVDVREPEEVARAMQQLATDHVLRNKLSDAAFEKAWSHFRADVVVPQYEALYRDFAARLQPDGHRRNQGGERA
jgi:L-malate glycosyltransferase